MLDGFKKVIARGNMVDMADGVVMGAAVTGIVNALVDSIINPLIAAIFGKPDLSKTWNWTITNWAGENSVISHCGDFRQAGPEQDMELDDHELGRGELGHLLWLPAQRAAQLPHHRDRRLFLHRRAD